MTLAVCRPALALAVSSMVALHVVVPSARAGGDDRPDDAGPPAFETRLTFVRGNAASGWACDMPPEAPARAGVTVDGVFQQNPGQKAADP